ncbi:MAG: hypothetical protein R3C53_01580 [Pirellulaceae bacterium]
MAGHGRQNMEKLAGAGHTQLPLRKHKCRSAGWVCLCVALGLTLSHNSAAQTRPIQPNPDAASASLPAAAANSPAAAVTLQSPVESATPQPLREAPLSALNASNPSNATATTAQAGDAALGQPPEPAPSPAAVLKANASQRIEQLASDQERAAATKDTLTKLYQQIVVDATAAEQSAAARANWAQRSAVAAQALDSIREKKEKLKQTGGAERPLFMSFEEGQSRQSQLEAELTTAAAERAKLNEQITTREKRRKELPQLISDAKAKLGELAKVSPPENSSDEPLFQEAIGWVNAASKIALEERVAELESEQRAYEAETTLLPLQLEVATAVEKQLQERLTIVSEEMASIRQDRILSKRSAVYDLVKKLPESMRARGEEILKRIQNWLDLSEKQAAVKQELETSKALLTRWKVQRDKMDSRVNPQPGAADASGFNSWVGMMLRKQRSELPDPAELSASTRHYQSEMQVADSLLYELDDALFDIRAEQENLEKTIQAETDDFEQLGAASVHVWRSAKHTGLARRS